MTELLTAPSNICSELIADLTNSIIRENIMPSEWDDRFIFRVFEGNGEAIEVTIAV